MGQVLGFCRNILSRNFSAITGSVTGPKDESLCSVEFSVLMLVTVYVSICLKFVKKSEFYVTVCLGIRVPNEKLCNHLALQLFCIFLGCTHSSSR